MDISVIIPVLNEAACIVSCLRRLQPWRASGCEVIVVDGGSDDGSAALAQPLADRVLEAPTGRAAQLRAGCAAARGALLLFLHADTQLPDTAPELLEKHAGPCCWGRFDLRLSGAHPLFRLIERCINWRSRITGVATGDQAMFVGRALYLECGGFPLIPLMEDVALSKVLLRHGRPLCLHPPVLSSSRRWEQHGILRTVLLMWRLRLAFAWGVHPEQLARRYR